MRGSLKVPEISSRMSVMDLEGDAHPSKISPKNIFTKLDGRHVNIDEKCLKHKSKRKMKTLK